LQVGRCDLAIARQSFYALVDLEFSRGDIFRDVPFPSFKKAAEVSDEPSRWITVLSQISADAAVDEPDTPTSTVVEIDQTAGLAMCVTPTCDIASSEYLSFVPLQALEGIPDEEISLSALFSRKAGYEELFGIYDPTDGMSGDCFAQFALVFPVPRNVLGDLRAKKLQSLGLEAHDLLTEKLARYFGKSWGYSPTEAVEVAGLYGCIHCRTFHGLPLNEVQLNAGDLPPNCEVCRRHKRVPSWRLLRTPKKPRVV
jgi:hypothetical protein